MAYITHNFVDGEILYAQPLNEMDEQILLNSQIVSPEAETKKITEFSMLGGMSRKGKNLLDIAHGTSLSNAKYENDTVVITNNTYSNYVCTFNVAESGSYYFSIVGTPTNGTINAQIKVNGTTIYENNINGLVTLPYTLNANDVFTMNLRSASGGSGIFSNIMLEKGSVKTDYEPYTPNLIDGKVDDIVVYGKNLTDINLLGTSYYYYADGQIRTTGKEYLGIIEQYKVNKGEKYTLSCETTFPSSELWPTIIMWDKNKKYLGYVGDYRRSITANISEDGYIAISVYRKNEIKKEDILSIQLEKGSVATSHVPYRETTHNPIPSSVLSLPNYGIGVNNNVYNYSEYVDGKVLYHERANKIKVTSVTSFANRPNGDLFAKVNNIYDAKKTPNGTIGNVICNVCEATSADTNYAATYSCVCLRTDGSVQICLSNIKTGADLTSFINNNNVEIVYELETEIITDVTDKINGIIIPFEDGGRVELHYPNSDLYALDIPTESTTEIGYLDTIYHDGKPVYPKTLASQVIGLVDNSGIEMDLLWTNAMPESPFDPQTVGINLSNYKILMIHYKNSRLEEPIFAQMNIVGTSVILFSTEANQAFILFRKLSSNSSGVTFGPGKQNTSTSENSAWVVPYTIYGIK